MHIVFNFYKFISIPDLPKTKFDLLTQLKKYNLLGTILLAPEGINGGICGEEQNIHLFKSYLELIIGQEYISFLSTSEMAPFTLQRVKIKPEIIKMGKDCLTCKKGIYLSPIEWNDFLQDKNTIVFDTRNIFESNIGRFKGSITPPIQNFSDFPKYFLKHYGSLDLNTKMGMYCTGGIRCEKTTSFLLDLGYRNVYHLRGGILAYLKDIHQDESLWIGGCYIFDKRVVINHQLEHAKYKQCFACRQPLSAEDQKDTLYIPGVSCASCFNNPRINRCKLIRRQEAKSNQV